MALALAGAAIVRIVGLVYVGGFTKNGAGLPAPRRSVSGSHRAERHLFWSSPPSPAHLDRTAAKAAAGDVNGAVKDYLSQADSSASSKSRGEAMWRSSADSRRQGRAADRCGHA